LSGSLHTCPLLRKRGHGRSHVTATPTSSPGLLEERLESVYKVDPRYSDKATTMFNIDLGVPEVRRAGGWGGVSRGSGCEFL
jgi:hypothetical protein